MDVRWLCKALGGTSALGLVGVLAIPAAATPGPRQEEWYFSSWEVQNKVWPITKGKGVVVAVIDSGVNANLPDLAGAVLPGTSITAGHKGDGRRDIGDGKDGHGTAMAALIAGQGIGPARMVGVAPEAKILPVVASVSLDEGITYAVDHGAKVISISLGVGIGECDRYIQAAVGYAIAHDVVVVASAGNSGDTSNSPVSPATCAGVLAVGAVDFQNNAWADTQRQPYVAVAAPGVLVQSLSKNGSFTRGYSGTSQAAALTSASVALVRSRFPRLSAREVVQRIIASARDSGPRRGKDLATGYGIVRPWHALIDKVPMNAPNPVFAAYDRWKKAQGGQAADTPRAGSSAPAAARGRDSGGTGGGTATMLAIVAAVIVLAALIAGSILWRRARSRRRPSAPPYTQAVGPLYPPGGPQPYRPTPPPSFGGPPAPHPRQGPPPGGEPPRG